MRFYDLKKNQFCCKIQHHKSRKGQIRCNLMSEPKFELPKNLTPSGDGNNREIQEIVSPVQPQQRTSGGPSGLVPFLVVLVCALIGGAALYDRWPTFEYRIKEAKAPESESSNPVPTPSVVMALTVSPTPTPQISSISTDEPSVAHAVVPTPVQPAKPTPTPIAQKIRPTPTIAGAQTTRATTRATTYTSPYGYVVSLRAGESISAEGPIAAVYDAVGALVLRIEATEMLLETSAALGHQLTLSSDVSNVQAIVVDGNGGYSYRIAGRPARALVRGNTVYYVIEYKSGGMEGFRIK